MQRTVHRRLHIAHQRRARFEKMRNIVEPLCLRKVQQPLEQVHLGKQRGALELRDNTKQLQSMLVADADGHRNRNDAAEYRGPESDDKTLVRFTEDDQLVACLHAPCLQRAEQRE